VVAVLAVTLLAGLLVGRFVVAGGDGGAAPPLTPAATDAAATVARLQAELRRRPDEPRLLTQLGVAYVTRARETADPSFYTKAAGVLERASELAPRDAATMTARGLLDLGRHDFRAAFAWGTRALRANPDATDAAGPVGNHPNTRGRTSATSAGRSASIADAHPGPDHARIGSTRTRPSGSTAATHSVACSPSIDTSMHAATRDRTASNVPGSHRDSHTA